MNHAVHVIAHEQLHHKPCKVLLDADCLDAGEVHSVLA